MAATVALSSTETEAEVRELSDVLCTQRKIHDQLRMDNRTRKTELETLNNELRVMQQMISVTTANKNDQRSVQIGSELESAHTGLEEAKGQGATFKHMHMRLLDEKTELEQHFNQLQDTWQRAQQEHESTSSAHIKAQQAKSQAEAERAQLLHDIATEHEAARQRRLDALKKQVAEAERQYQRREVREAKRVEMAQQLSDQLDDDPLSGRRALEVKLQYRAILEAKLFRFEAKANTLQEGFAKLQHATSAADVSEVIAHYLNREDAVESVRRSTEENQANIEATRAEIEELRLERDRLVNAQAQLNMSSRGRYQELSSHQVMFSEARKEFSDCQTQLLRANVMLEDIKQCVRKLLGRIDPSASLEITSEQLPELLEEIESTLLHMTSNLSQKVASEGGGKDDRAFMGSSDGGDSSVRAADGTADAIYQSLLDASVPNVTDRNVRVETRPAPGRTPSPTPNNQQRELMLADPVSLTFAPAPAAAAEPAEVEQEEGPQAGEGFRNTTMDRESLKKISAMLQDRAAKAQAGKPQEGLPMGLVHA